MKLAGKSLMRITPAAALGLAWWLCLGSAVHADPNPAPEPAPSHASPASKQDEQPMTMEQFLDRLMHAESGGHLAARNPRSTALGPYQFIASTWLMIANRHFAKETKALRVGQVLALRIDPALARRAAEIYTLENAAYLVAHGHAATFPNLRLAFLVGPGGAARILSAQPEMPVNQLLSPNVIAANPFMTRLTVADLIARCARDLLATPDMTAGVTPDDALVSAAKEAGATPMSQARMSGVPPCNLTLPSCRRWVALAERRQGKKQRRASQ